MFASTQSATPQLARSQGPVEQNTAHQGNQPAHGARSAMRCACSGVSEHIDFLCRLSVTASAVGELPPSTTASIHASNPSSGASLKPTSAAWICGSSRAASRSFRPLKLQFASNLATLSATGKVLSKFLASGQARRPVGIQFPRIQVTSGGCDDSCHSEHEDFRHLRPILGCRLPRSEFHRVATSVAIAFPSSKSFFSAEGRPWSLCSEVGVYDLRGTLWGPL